MKKLLVCILLSALSPSAFAATVNLPMTKEVKNYCTAGAPTVPAGVYVKIATTVVTGAPPTAITELDEIGRTFVITITRDGSDNVTAVSCPIVQ